MDVPEHCPGVQSESAGKVSACQGCPNQSICSSGDASKVDPGVELVKARLSTVKHKILVLSGKGGVGKSTVSSLLARGLAATNENQNVAVLDVDICGPSMPRVMGVLDEKVHQSGSGWSPVFVDDNLCVMSVGFLLASNNDAVIWRGPKKNALIRQFFTEVDWGEKLEYLIIDTPPGTSDEHLSIAQYLKDVPNVIAVVVTTPQEVSLLDVRKEINFLRKVNIPIVGVVENMSTFVCPKCKAVDNIFPADTGGALKMAQELSVPFLGSLPLDPIIARSCDKGLNPVQEHPESEVIKNLKSIITKKTRREVMLLEPNSKNDTYPGLSKRIDDLEADLKNTFKAELINQENSLKIFISNTLHSLVKKMTKFKQGDPLTEENLVHASADTDTFWDDADFSYFPFRDVKMIQLFDAKLDEDLRLKKRFTAFIANKCSVTSHPTENIKSVAPCIYTRAITKHCNWSGQNDKFPLKFSSAAETILNCVVKYSSKCNDRDAQQEAQKQMITWFKNKADLVTRSTAKKSRGERQYFGEGSSSGSATGLEAQHAELSSSSFPEISGANIDEEENFMEGTCFVKMEL